MFKYMFNLAKLSTIYCKKMEATAWQSPPIGSNSEIADLRVKRPVFDERQDIVDVRIEITIISHHR